MVNLLLMVMMNSFILLTGGWALLQMIIFRKQEPEVCVVSTTGSERGDSVLQGVRQRRVSTTERERGETALQGVRERRVSTTE